MTVKKETSNMKIEISKCDLETAEFLFLEHYSQNLLQAYRLISNYNLFLVNSIVVKIDDYDHLWRYNIVMEMGTKYSRHYNIGESENQFDYIPGNESSLIFAFVC